MRRTGSRRPRAGLADLPDELLLRVLEYAAWFSWPSFVVHRVPRPQWDDRDIGRERTSPLVADVVEVAVRHAQWFGRLAAVSRTFRYTVADVVHRRLMFNLLAATNHEALEALACRWATAHGPTPIPLAVIEQPTCTVGWKLVALLPHLADMMTRDVVDGEAPVVLEHVLDECLVGWRLARQHCAGPIQPPVWSVVLAYRPLYEYGPVAVCGPTGIKRCSQLGMWLFARLTRFTSGSGLCAKSAPKQLRLLFRHRHAPLPPADYAREHACRVAAEDGDLTALDLWLPRISHEGRATCLGIAIHSRQWRAVHRIVQVYCVALDAPSHDPYCGSIANSNFCRLFRCGSPKQWIWAASTVTLATFAEAWPHIVRQVASRCHSTRALSLRALLKAFPTLSLSSIELDYGDVHNAACLRFALARGASLLSSSPRRRLALLLSCHADAEVAAELDRLDVATDGNLVEELLDQFPWAVTLPAATRFRFARSAGQS